ncbi:MAG: 6-carboxytetrahydropterin synthase QueD, partial [Chloroflexi bacterium]|nr:6-carboxytetrahydropterin synthase QueD [Chloroflexota bacterium]
YEISVRHHFDAAHYLRGYQGKCENLHGHRFEVVANVRVQELDELGLAYDFSDLRKHLEKVVGRFDHTCLNDVPPFDRVNPSSENIASTVYGELRPLLKNERLLLHSVQVWESPQSAATYFAEG